MVALLVIGSIGFYVTYHETETIYDTELSHVAGLMVSLLSAEDQEDLRKNPKDADEKKVNPDIVELGNDFDHSGQEHERKLAFRIWKNGNLLFYSGKATGFGEERITAGFSNQEIMGKEWRFYVLADKKSGYTIEIAQRLHVRMMLIAKVLTTLFLPLILLLPICLMITWIGLRVGLKPLLVISEAVKRRSALDLTPLSIDQSLTEISPLIDSINGLLSNLDYALSKERRFTDLAAHELRTPIAIFKTQAETALRSIDDRERRMILEAQVKAADRATTMVDQLLILARLEHADIPMEALSLGTIARDIMQERLPLSTQKQIHLRFEEDTTVMIQGNKELLTILLTNVLDNAIKYSFIEGEISVILSLQGHMAVLTVADTGPGIPEDKLPYVTERFYRVSRNSEQSGAGLGLTIAKRAAEIMGAHLILRNKESGKGFLSIVQFPEYQ